MIRFQFFAYLLISALLVACSSKAPEQGSSAAEDSEAQRVIDRAIEAHGGDLYSKARIDFDFRGRHYVSIRDGGMFQYERIFGDTLEEQPVEVRDVLTNDSFTRYIEGKEVQLTAKKSSAYSNSVNSVLYFAQQPYFLNDPAVQKEYLGEVEFDGERYHAVEITFQQEGGGKDYEDIFIYWFHTQKYTMDYLGYSYEVDGSGLRFRKAYNVQVVEGIRFADYINYKGDYSKHTVRDLARLYKEGALEELSRIENKNIRVQLQHRN